MDNPEARTDFVRHAVAGHRFEPDESYVRDLLQLERLASTRPLGLASRMTLSNLVSRYPTEADAIVRELGMRPFETFEDERLRTLAEERLRLAERRHPLGRLTLQDGLGPFDF
jgi:hypothetical protein